MEPALNDAPEGGTPALGVDLAGLGGWEVVIAAGAGPCLRYAAEAFQAHVARATGSKPRIVTRIHRGRRPVFIGPSAPMAVSPAVLVGQAIGRVDRIGQKRDTRIHFPVYDGTLQVQLYDLLAKKVAVSVSTDGLDPESALQAAGVGEDEYLAGLSIGKQLWAMLNGPG